MLPKKNRVSTKEVEEIFKACPPNGKKGGLFNSPNLSFRYFKNNNKEIKISFIAPKSIAKLAVQRNFLRRLGYHALEKYTNQFPLGIIGIFIFKKYQDDVLIIENEIKTILNKIS